MTKLIRFPKGTISHSSPWHLTIKSRRRGWQNPSRKETVWLLWTEGSTSWDSCSSKRRISKDWPTKWRNAILWTGTSSSQSNRRMQKKSGINWSLPDNRPSLSQTQPILYIDDFITPLLNTHFELCSMLWWIAFSTLSISLFEDFSLSLDVLDDTFE